MSNPGYRSMERRLANGAISPEEAPWLDFGNSTANTSWRTDYITPVGTLVERAVEAKSTENPVFDHYLTDGSHELVEGHKLVARWKNGLNESISLRVKGNHHITARHKGYPGRESQFNPELDPTNVIELFLGIYNKSLPTGRRLFAASVDHTEPVGWNGRRAINELIEEGKVDRASWKAALEFKDQIFDLNTFGEATIRTAKAKKLTKELGSDCIKFFTRGSRQNKIVPIIETDEIPVTSSLSVVLGVQGNFDTPTATVITALPGSMRETLPFDLEFEAEQIEKIAGKLSLAQLVRKFEAGQNLSHEQSALVASNETAHHNAWATPLIRLRR